MGSLCTSPQEQEQDQNQGAPHEHQLHDQHAVYYDQLKSTPDHVHDKPTDSKPIANAVAAAAILNANGTPPSYVPSCVLDSLHSNLSEPTQQQQHLLSKGGSAPTTKESEECHKSPQHEAAR